MVAATATKRVIGGRSDIGLVILGQSNERGQAIMSERAGYPRAFYSQYNPAVTSYFPGVNLLAKASDGFYYAFGSMWVQAYDTVYAAGVDLQIANCSLGSLSFVGDVNDYPHSRTNSNPNVRGRRASIGGGDSGSNGHVTVQNGYVFEATTATQFFYFYRNESSTVQTVTGGDVLPKRLDYLYKPTSSIATTAGSPPDFTTATALGSTVTDGGVTWTNVGTAASFGYANSGMFAPGSIDGINGIGCGFDPYGILRRVIDYGRQLRLAGCTRVIVYFCNGQGDLGQSTNYQTALTNFTGMCRAAGFEVMLGLSCFQLTSANANSTTGNWDLLTTAVNNTLATYASDPYVYAGANLYTLMGSTEGANGLTYGTTGSDPGTHLNAPGSIAAGLLHGAAIKTVLGL